MKGLFKFHPQKSLFELRIFWLVSSVFMALAVGSGFVIYSHEDLLPRWDHVGFNDALIIFRVPLSILAVAIPVIALLASNHRSEQTRAQIIASSDQNNFANYYRHVEEFTKYVNGENAITSRLPVVRPRKLHKYLFPHAREGDFRIDPVVIENLADSCKRIGDELVQFWRGHTFTYKESITMIEKTFSEMLARFTVSWGPTGRPLTSQYGNVVVPGKTYKEWSKSIFERAQFTRYILDFDRHLIECPELEKLIAIKVDNFPEAAIGENQPDRAFKAFEETK